MKYQVYKVQNLVNQKVYIGITSRGYKNRLKGHLREVEAGSTFIFHNALRKYGTDAFELTLLETVSSAEQLKEREKFWIAAFDSTNRTKGYNMTLGGDGTFGRLHSEETREKIAVKRRGRGCPTLQKVEITNRLTGEVTVYDGITTASKALGKGPSYLSNYKLASDDKEFFIVNNLEVRLSKGYIVQVREKVGPTPEQKEKKVQELQAGVKAWREANPGLESKIQRERPASLAARKQVEQWTKDGKTLLATYPSTRDAAEATGAKKANIATCARGKENCYPKGFLWKYSQNTES